MPASYWLGIITRTGIHAIIQQFSIFSNSIHNPESSTMTEQKAEAPITVGRQAVVIIHGIGEQRPMDTLRSFVTGIKAYLTLTDPTEQTSVLRSKPDKASDTYETRMMSLSATRNRPVTDFYEFYWAHNMRDTAFKHTFTWIKKLVFSSPLKVPKRLVNLWVTVWAFVLLITLALIGILYVVGLTKIYLLVAAIVAFPVAVTILSFIQNIASSAFLTTAGDAENKKSLECIKNALHLRYDENP